jgi:phage antirepressor YoqD-like protein
MDYKTKMIADAEIFTLEAISKALNVDINTLTTWLQEKNILKKTSRKGSGATQFAKDAGYAKTLTQVVSIDGKDVKIKRFVFKKRGLDWLMKNFNK